MSGEYGHELCLLTGNANRPLAEKIASYLDTELADADVGRFTDGEVRVKIGESVRNQDVFVVQPTCATPEIGNSPNDNLVELQIMADAIKRASAWRLTAVMPYFGYARQDRKSEPHVPISSKLVAKLIGHSGVDRVLLLDLHAAQIEGFFDEDLLKVDHLQAAHSVFIPYLHDKAPDNAVICCTDHGGAERMRVYAQALNADQAIIDKTRKNGNGPEVTHFLGDVSGRDVVIIDDMISTASSLDAGVKVLREHGAESLYVVATHGVLCGPAMERIERLEFKEVIITDSIPHSTETLPSNVQVLSVAKLVGEGIRRIHKSMSIGEIIKPGFAFPESNPIKR